MGDYTFKIRIEEYLVVDLRFLSYAFLSETLDIEVPQAGHSMNQDLVIGCSPSDSRRELYRGELGISC